MRSARAWLAQTARPRRSAVADGMQRYGGMSPIVSASQRCSVSWAVSRVVMAPGLIPSGPGRQGPIPRNTRRRQSAARALACWRWHHGSRGIAGHGRGADGPCHHKKAPRSVEDSMFDFFAWGSLQSVNALRRPSARANHCFYSVLATYLSIEIGWYRRDAHPVRLNQPQLLRGRDHHD
jgi:hypothetical protein